jgi:hypothetical protein
MTDLTDEEIDAICAGYVQAAAKVRYLERMGLTVRKKPNGRPLVNRRHYDDVTRGQKSEEFNMEPCWST